MISRPSRRRALLLLACVIAAACALLPIACLHAPDTTWRVDVTAPDAIPEPTLDPLQARKWVLRGRLPRPFVVTDLASTPAGLVIAAAVRPLDAEGAAIFRHDHAGHLETLLSWNGEGFLRVHAFGNRLVVPDSDAPFSFLEFALRWKVDEFLFISDVSGRLDTSAREVVPCAYHAFDAARLADGRVVVSTGAFPPDAIAYRSKEAPAALFVDGGPGRPFQRVVEWPSPHAIGVHRFTYLHALPDGGLLAAIQSSDPFAPAALRFSSSLEPFGPVTGLDGQTLRFHGHGERTYAITQGEAFSTLFVAEDGTQFQARTRGVPGNPQALVTVGDAHFLLADGGLFGSPDGNAYIQLAAPQVALQHAWSTLVSAPLVLHEGSPWSGSPATGELFEAVPAR